MKAKWWVVALMVCALAGCALSTEDLTAEVQKSMQEKFKSSGVTIKSLVLSKKGGNVYSGVLTTNEPDEVVYSVEVVYDGENMTWKIVE